MLYRSESSHKRDQVVGHAMTQLTNTLKSVTGAGTFDRVILIASILLVAVVAFHIRSTIAAVSVDVAIAEVGVPTR